MIPSPVFRMTTVRATLLVALGVVCGLVHAQEAMGPMRVLELARLNDQQYRSAKLDVDATREDSVQARAQLRPSVSYSATSSQVDRTTLFDNKQSQFESLNKTLSVRQAIYRRNVSANVDRADAALRAGEYSFDLQGQLLVAKVITAYTDVLLAQQALAQAQAVLALAQAQLDAALLSQRQGLGTVLQVNEAKAKAQMAKVDVDSNVLQLQVARDALQTHIGQDVTGLLGVEWDQVERSDWLKPMSLAEWTERALATSPVLLAATAQVEVAQQDVERARAGHWPTLDAFYQHTISQGENVQSPTYNYRSQTLGLQLTIPLYAGGGTESVVRQALSKLEKAQVNLSVTRRALIEQVGKDHRQYTEGRLKLLVLQTTLKDASLAISAMRQAYAAGLGTQVQVLQALADEAKLRRDQLDALKTYLTAFYSLHAYSGTIRDEDLAVWLSVFKVPPELGAPAVAQAPR